MNEATHGEYTTICGDLYLAFELGNKDWKLGFTVGLGQDPWRRKINAGDLAALQREISHAKKWFGLPETARGLSCYEAGREGFWLHRHLLAEGIESLVVDSASIEVKRRRKRAKTDRLDVDKLVTMLIRYHSGEKKVWSVVHVPSVRAEDNRHLHRALKSLKGDRTRHINRIKGLLVGQGIRMPVGTDFLENWSGFACGMGHPYRPGYGPGWNASTGAWSL